MKKILFVAIAIALSLYIAWLLGPLPAHSVAEARTVQTITETIYVEKPALSSAQIIWLARLMNCESGIRDGAINPVDLDGTPSNGILQFKDTTFASFADKYGIEGTLMDAEAQVSIVTYWILNPGEVVWENQFPDCVKKYGKPPII